MTLSDDNHDIAIIGMAGRFPGARNVDEFWAKLVRGEESIRRLSDEELLRAGVARRDIDDPDYVKACPVLDDIDKFDAAFFGISPRDASVMDPAHRFFLEVSWQALENSGNTGLADEGRVGVFASSGAPLYWVNNVCTHREIVASMGEFLVRHTGNDMNFLATRASYDLDLRGPSINVQTACSSALVAAHLARQSLLARECDMALIGGSTILVPMGQGYHYKEGEILSPDGHCRPFDHRSAGTVFGSGTACLVLKRLNDALDNGDTIHAVIKGSATNNDGAVKVGFLAPGVEGQVDVIREALKSANVNARSIGYVEAHGTGTSVGDPIELTALQQVFSEQTHDKQFCGLGSVKSNIGHLGEAAGAVSLIKVVLALKHRMLPPSLGYERPNPRFSMDDSAFYVNSALRPWDSAEPLRAGITALGAGGTNCHLVLEEPPAAMPGQGARERQVLLLSAKSKAALDRMSENLAAHLQSNPSVDLADAAYTLAFGRRSLTHRRALVAADRAEAVSLLRGGQTPRVFSAAADTADPGVVYTFPGGGAQYARMGFDLYACEPAYRRALDECLAIVDREIDPAVRELLFASEANAAQATRQLQRPTLALPTLFCVEYALARLFDAYGLRPVAYVGHSMGEYVAACLAGVFSLRDGLRLVHLRGRLFETTPKGRMIGVSLSEADTRRLMPEGLSIAAVNAPDLCVASGPVALIEQFGQTLSGSAIDWTPIHIDVAAHSSLLDPILAEFRAFCRTVAFSAPKLPVASNLTGQWLTAAQATDPEYWVKHLRGTVRFADCVETVLAGGSHVFLEVGPGRTLTTLVGAQKTKLRHSFNTVRHPTEMAHDADYALLTLGKVWAAGATVDWTALYDEQLRNRIALPGYPFDAQSYWIEPKAGQLTASPELIKRDDIDTWFSATSWEPTPLAGSPIARANRWLLISRRASRPTGLAEALALQLGAGAVDGGDIVLANAGPRFRRVDDKHFELNLESTEQIQQLLETLRDEGRAPEHVVLLPGEIVAGSQVAESGLGARFLQWGGTVLGRSHSSPGPAEVAWADAEERLRANYFAPVHVAQAIGSVLGDAAFTVVTENAFSVRGEALDPLARLAMGPAQVVPREQPELVTRLIDLDASDDSAGAVADRAQQLSRELLGADTASPVALRTPSRWVSHLRPTRLPPAGAPMSWIADGDVVLITGGLGGIGLVLAEHLARRNKLKFALLSREGLPDRQTWTGLLAAPTTPPSLTRRIAKVHCLEALGAEVLAVRADVTDTASLRAALAVVRDRLGPVSIVIHAAGTMDDAPLQTKTDDRMRRVLAPKVLGARHLDELLGEDIKAFVLMSSVASFLGLPGQVDYTAANAFLDAFAEERQRRRPGRTLAINWNAWRDVGMVVDGALRPSPDPLPAGRPNHPWLDASEPTPHGQRYFADFGTASHWLLEEHRIAGGDALIPGTGLVELARAAFADAVSKREGWPVQSAESVELRQVTFLSPFRVGPGQARRLRMDVEWEGSAARVTLQSADGVETYMTAEAAPCNAVAETTQLGNLLARCLLPGATRDGFLDQDFVRFGPRWQNIRELRLGEREAVVRLALPERYAAEPAQLTYHPALLDMATGAAQALIPGFDKERDFLVPFGYDRVRIFSSPLGEVISHVRLRPESTAAIASFDVTLYDGAGVELIAVQGFTMKRVDAGAAILLNTPERSSAAAAPELSPAMQAVLREAIAPSEGVIAFDRAMAQTELSQLVVSSVDVKVWSDKLALDAQRLKADDSAAAGPSFSRPTLGSEFVPIEGELEAALASIWCRLLGVSDVGALDDFFELGGNSLVAVRLFARVKKEFSVTLPLSTLFQAPTIRALAAAVREHGYRSPAVQPPALKLVAAPPAAVAARIRADDNPPLLIRPGQGKPPLFFVHDGLGEVLLYRSLALRLDCGHAVYGLEPETSEGRFIHTSIVEMARAKIDRIRSVQPHGPYLLAGLCAGGVIAFELARQLQAAGERVAFVGIIDGADVAAAEIPLRVARQRIGNLMGSLWPAPGQPVWSAVARALPILLRKLANLVVYEVASRLRRVRTAQELAAMRSGSLHEGRVEFFSVYEAAHRQHVATGMLNGASVALFRATRGDGSSADLPFREVYVDPLMGWQTRVERTVLAIDVPGGHSTALQEPHVAVLAHEMQRNIDNAIACGETTARPQLRIATS